MGKPQVKAHVRVDLGQIGEVWTFEGRAAEIVSKFAQELTKHKVAVAEQHVGGFQIDITQASVIVRRSETGAPHHFLTPPGAERTPLNGA
jgi:hypothetical protein